MTTQQKPALRYLPGDGTEVMVEVAFLSDYPRGTNGRCAFCNGDPCAETSLAGTLIHDFYERNPKAETCPMCDGKPS